MTRRALTRPLAACTGGLLATSLTVVTPPPAEATVSTVAERDATAFVTAIARDPSVVASATWLTLPPNGKPAAVGPVWETNTVPLHGESLGVLSTGDATYDYGLQSTELKTDNGGGAYRGANDVVSLRVSLAVPPTSNCVAVAVKYFSEDAPLPTNGLPEDDGEYMDGFLAELDPRTPWEISGTVRTAPAADFARTAQGNIFDAWMLVTSNNPYEVDPDAAGRAATTSYNAASEWWYAMTPVSPGPHSVDLTVFDRGDSVVDSSAVLDDLRLVNRTAATCTGMVPADVAGFATPSAPTTKVKKNDRRRTAKVTFSAPAGPDESRTYECALDGKAFAPCTSPTRYTRLKRGKHVVAVRAIDGAGNISSTSTARFKIKRVKK